MEKLKEVSAFFPAYNEEGNIENVVRTAVNVLSQHADNYEIIVVDDGSSDKTAEIVRNLSKENDKIRVVSHKKNMGYGMALRTGFKSCRYEWIVFTDSDGQFNFSEFPNFIKEQERTKADLVIGYYIKRKVSPVRKMNSRFWQLLIWILLGLKVRDIDCGFKFIRKKVIDSMVLTSERGAFISTEFLVKAKEKKFKIVEIPASHYPRKAGQATGASLKVILSSFWDLYKIKKTFIRFFFVGATSSLMSILLFNLFFALKLSFTLSLLFSLLSSIIYNFSMNKYLTFSAGKGMLKEQIWKYAVVYSIAHGTNFIVSNIANRLLGGGTIMANVSVLIGIAVSIPFSFFGYLLWVFKDKKL
mgnify:CR=1 FL=1